MKENRWRKAALRVGEDLAAAGPDGYYTFTPEQWRDWCLAAIAWGRAEASLRERPIPSGEKLSFDHTHGFTAAPCARLHCSQCGKSVSTPFTPEPTDTPDKGLIVRAWIECPECLEAKNQETLLLEVAGFLTLIAKDIHPANEAAQAKELLEKIGAVLQRVQEGK